MALVHVWSTRQRNRAVRSGLQPCIIAQVADAILAKQARVENPDKDAVPRGAIVRLHQIVGACASGAGIRRRSR